MSHFSNIKTKLRDLASLKAALSDMGCEWKEGPRPVRGYQGRTETAALVVEQENNYDIGFRWNGNEYELLADLQYWQQPLTVEGFLRKLGQGYAIHAILSATATQGFQVTEQQKNTDGSVRLVVQRWRA
jgi:hypothetical protein